VEGNWNRPPTNFGLKVALGHPIQIEYLIQTNNILMYILYSKLMRNAESLAVFNTT